MSTQLMEWRGTRACIVLAMTILTLAVAGSAAAAPAWAVGSVTPVRVMSRNLYLGADLGIVFSASTADDIPYRVAAFEEMVDQTDFPARAQVLAKEIQDSAPDVIGLQEASLFRMAPFDTDTWTTKYDYLQPLQNALSARGDPYTVAVAQVTSDGALPSANGYRLRLTQRNTILVKADLSASINAIRSGLYGPAATLQIPIPGCGSIADQRGWVSADMAIQSRGFRVIDTHLDSTVAYYRWAQSNELLSGPAATTLPVVLLGDLNTDPRDPAPSAFNNLIANGFGNSAPATSLLTCCYKGTLLNTNPLDFTARYDHVLTRPRIRTFVAVITGINPVNRTPSGLWPSDHAGVVVSLAL